MKKAVTTKHLLHYNIVMKREPQGGYTVTVPALPGCVTFGKTIEEAEVMAKDAIEVYIASLEKHREQVPKDQEVFITTVTLTIPSGKKTYA